MPNETSPKPSANALKLEMLSVQIKLARLELHIRRQQDRQAAEAARLELRQKRANTVKSEIELEAACGAAAASASSDAANGHFMFCESVTWATTKAAIAELNRISRLSPGSPLTVILNSPGGSVIAGLALYDHIRDLSRNGHQMIVKVRGIAASMGGILLQAGDSRVIGPEALILIHEVSSTTFGKVSEMQDDLTFTLRLWEKLASILARRSTITEEQLMEKARKFDWWLDANEAVQLGFADEIG